MKTLLAPKVRQDVTSRPLLVDLALSIFCSVWNGKTVEVELFGILEGRVWENVARWISAPKVGNGRRKN